MNSNDKNGEAFFDKAFFRKVCGYYWSIRVVRKVSFMKIWMRREDPKMTKQLFRR
jgi:hypothetical protein